MKAIASALAIVVAVVAPPAFAQIATPAISVSGEASVAAAPDLAILDAGVTSDARTAREASDFNNAAMGKVLLALKNAGIPERDVQTQRLSLQPQYSEQRNAASPTITSYRASNRVAVKLRDMTLVATTLDLLVGAGANEIGGVDFSVAQPSKLLDDARTQAVADARRKAEILAKAAGVELGAALIVSEDSSPPVFARKAFRAASASPAAVAPGEETLRVIVSVKWAIKQAAETAKPAQ